ncbi:MAG: glycoside hydrolase family 3 C-terminal domain-containing protein [Spirochaetaceae bacterium]|jgi:beta-glucosidase|nr:glycoside hydrolase family 3 C-terminal domain-containing protein [Spirochaetaceae bacterium]
MNTQDLPGLLKELTLEEKASLLSGKGYFITKEVGRLGIPSLFLSDGPHGLRKQIGAADQMGLNPSMPATCYPTAATVANSWDTALGEELGRYLGVEARAQGVSILLGPGLNIKRNPLCGRNFEYFSEDPYLSGKLAAAYIRGIQSKGIAACPKHFAANSQELRRMHNDSLVDERALRELYLTGFEIAVSEGKPLFLMTSYNRLNGTYTNENRHLLREILAEEWGYNGMVVTDWGGSNDRVQGLVMGNHLEMPATNGDSDREIVRAVEEGRISESLLDQRVGEYLRVLALLAPTVEPTENFDADAHHAFARKAAAASIVLLKNEDGILPLKAGTKTAVLGCFAETPRYQGAGSSVVNPTRVDVPLDHLKKSGLEITGYAGAFKRNGGDDKALLAAAVELAKQADVVLLYLGLDELLESEGMDREHLRLRENQAAALEAVSAANPRVVVVLSGGAAVETPWLGRCKALIHGYLGGQAGAGAMVDALTGAVNPSGKLAETWPLVYEDVPSYNYYPGKERTSEYRESLFVGYRYYDTVHIPVRFPFGYGLSYTTFAYADLSADEKSVTFTLTNTGGRAGAEIAQVYVSAKDSRLFRPRRELKAFTKVYLEAGESKTVTLPLDEKAFRYFNAVTGRFETETGVYRIEAGASAQDIRLETEIRVSGSTAAPPYSPETLPSYYAATINNVSDKEFETLLGRPLPQAKWDRSKPLERNDTFSQLFYARGWIGRLVYKVVASGKDRIGKDGRPDLNMLFIFNMPFRGIAKMMGGAVDMVMVDAMLEIFNGRALKGIGHLAAAWVRKGKAARKTAQKLALAKGTKPH